MRVDLLRVSPPAFFLQVELEFGPKKDGQMKPARFTEVQSIFVLKNHEVGRRRPTWLASMEFRSRPFGECCHFNGLVKRHHCNCDYRTEHYSAKQGMTLLSKQAHFDQGFAR